MLAAETDAARCYEILDSEIPEALTGLRTLSAKMINLAAETARAWWDPFPNDLAANAPSASANESEAETEQASRVTIIAQEGGAVVRIPIVSFD